MRFWRNFGSPVVKSRFFAMGTEVSVTVSIGRGSSRRTAAQAAIVQVERLIQSFGHDWWAWGSGALFCINAQLAAGKVAQIPTEMRSLFASAWSIQQSSAGRFDPRIASLVRLWRFHDFAAMSRVVPEIADINRLLDALRSAPDYDGGGSYGPAPGVGWDFGGIGKGWIVDAALDLLRDKGFPDAIVDAGGNLAVRGARAHMPWRIGIRDPRSEIEDSPRLIASLFACDEAVNTHGDDQRFFEFDGRRYGHILNPFTGWPAAGIQSLTVVHADGTLAEAGGAALYIAGCEGWRDLARELGLDQVLVVTDNGEVHATTALAKRVRPENGTRLRVNE